MTLRATDSGRRQGASDSRLPFVERGSLRLFVRREPFLADWRGSIAALVSRPAPKSSHSVNHFLHCVNLARTRFSGRSLGASFVLHCVLVALAIYVQQVIPANASPLNDAPAFTGKIYYRVPVVQAPKLPRLAPTGPGGRPGAGSSVVRLPALGSTVRRPNMTIVSRPVHPDNFRQTIFQPSSPPDLRITTEQKLPNIVFGQALERLKAPLNPNNTKPSLTNRQFSAVEAPSLSTSSQKSPLMSFLPPSDTQPRLAIPVSGGGAPIQRTAANSGDPAGGNSDVAGLVVLGVDPAGSSAQVSLPAGNRWGQFSIAPPGADNGSPGGDPNGSASGGTGSGSSAGDASTGVGHGTSGGGGGNSGTPGPLSVSGSGTGGSGGMLDPSLPVNMIYPVAAPPLNIRRNTLVISAGPIGGGGLNVYGALKCGKIYSIFLPMPGRNWSMQYCDSSGDAKTVSSGGYTAVLHLENPLLPPDVDLSHRFDFKRVPVPVEKAHRSIVLKGILGVDGTVQHVVVYQGVTEKMDEAARLAFSRWRFKPAMRNGKPVEVQILVGIPPEKGEDRVSR
jgi:Gram-negative bacterial TonB protein C-terminal